MIVAHAVESTWTKHYSSVRHALLSSIIEMAQPFRMFMTTSHLYNEFILHADMQEAHHCYHMRSIVDESETRTLQEAAGIGKKYAPPVLVSFSIKKSDPARSASSAKPV